MSIDYGKIIESSQMDLDMKGRMQSMSRSLG